MPVLNHLSIHIDIKEYYGSRGVIDQNNSTTSPKVALTTLEAIKRSNYLIFPRVTFQIYKVDQINNDHIYLESRSPLDKRYYLSGQLIIDQLVNVTDVIVAICTIGKDYDNAIASMYALDPHIAAALDSIGSHAIEKLSNQVCAYFKHTAKIRGLNTTIALNPGMVGWPIELGQPQIFSMVDGEEIGVSLDESCMMIPSKSLSLVIGMGTDVPDLGVQCNLCRMKGICKNNNNYE